MVPLRKKYYSMVLKGSSRSSFRGYSQGSLRVPLGVPLRVWDLRFRGLGFRVEGSTGTGGSVKGSFKDSSRGSFKGSFIKFRV